MPADTRLGGYDEALADNIETLSNLQRLCDDLDLSHHTLVSPESPAPPQTQVLFILNFTTAQRSFLLSSPNTLALLYTPANEHFGIVPIEAMASGLPVLAADSGGPTETVVDLSSSNLGTGLLREPSPDLWSIALGELINLPPDRRKEVSDAARERVAEKFSAKSLGRELDDACREALAMGDIHSQLGDRMIWGGAVLIGNSVLALGFTIWLTHA